GPRQLEAAAVVVDSLGPERQADLRGAERRQIDDRQEPLRGGDGEAGAGVPLLLLGDVRRAEDAVLGAGRAQALEDRLGACGTLQDRPVGPAALPERGSGGG